MLKKCVPPKTSVPGSPPGCPLLAFSQCLVTVSPPGRLTVPAPPSSPGPRTWEEGSPGPTPGTEQAVCVSLFISTEASGEAGAQSRAGWRRSSSSSLPGGSPARPPGPQSPRQAQAKGPGAGRAGARGQGQGPGPHLPKPHPSRWPCPSRDPAWHPACLGPVPQCELWRTDGQMDRGTDGRVETAQGAGGGGSKGRKAAQGKGWPHGEETPQRPPRSLLS